MLCVVASTFFVTLSAIWKPEPGASGVHNLSGVSVNNTVVNNNSKLQIDNSGTSDSE